MKGFFNISPVAIVIKSLWSQIEDKYKAKIFRLLILMLLASFAELASIGALIPLISALLDPLSLYNKEFLRAPIAFFKITSPSQMGLPIAVLFSLMVIASRFISLALLKANLKLAYEIGSQLSCDAYFRTLHQSYETHISRNTAVISNVISGKISNVIALLNYCLNIITSFITVTVIFIGLFLLDPIKTVSVILFGLMFYVTINHYGKKEIGKNSQLISDYTNKISLSLQQGLGGIRDVLIDSSQIIFYKNFKLVDKVLRHAQGQNQIAASAPRFIIELLGMLLITWVAYFTALSNPDSIQIVTSLGVLIFSAQKLLPSFQQIYASWVGLLGGLASVNEVLYLLQQPVKYKNKDSLEKEKILFSDQISFSNVSFHYKNSSHLTLNKINFSIKKGERLGIVGESGAGKSTFLDILMGLLTPTDGELFIDGTLLTNLNKADWMRKIAHVPQSIALFDISIIENIAFGVEFERIDITRAHESAKRAKIFDFIMKLPNGFETNIGERGVFLSGGQRQRLGLARAFYKGAELLVLDEATSALDDATESEIMYDINELSRETTLVMVAHRLTTLRGCDRVVQIRDAEVIAHTLNSENIYI